MNRRFPLGLIGLVMILTGCDYQNKKPPILPSGIVDGPLPTAPGRPASSTASTIDSPQSTTLTNEIDPEIQRRRDVILANVINLMKTASINPGGQNFAIATDNLNDLFDQGTQPSDYEYNEESKKFLLRKIALLYNQDPEPIVKALSSPKFTIKDARHLEDCMLYHNVATRVAGEGDDLSKVRRIFDWVVRNVELIPAESLAAPNMRQAQARPADVLVRGMATEYGGYWSERGWLFMSLCRQIGVDVGILTFMPRISPLASPEVANRPPVAWVTAAAIDGKLYLFEQRLGIEIPGPDGTGVATLDEALTNPIVLGRLDLPGSFLYGTTGEEIAASTTRIGVLLDSSPGYFAPRMRLLQGQLRGEYRTILFRDALEQARNFAQALGPRVGLINLWELPTLVEQSLFTKPEFVAATQMSLQFFRSELPLLLARTAHLRGNLEEAIEKYGTLRFAQGAVMNDADKTPITPEVQTALDVYSTFFLAQCQMDRGKIDEAEFLFRMLVKMTPEPGPGRYYFYMLRWSALSNLGRICEKKGDYAGAIKFYSENIQANERHGNMLKARELIWNDPFREPAPPLAPAPSPPPPPASESKPAVKPAAG